MPLSSLKASNINVSHGAVTDSSGKQAVGLKVSFNVGDHGPFYLNYGDSQTPIETVKRDIQKQVDDLNSLHDWAQ